MWNTDLRKINTLNTHKGYPNTGYRDGALSLSCSVCSIHCCDRDPSKPVARSDPHSGGQCHQYAGHRGPQGVLTGSIGLHLWGASEYKCKCTCVHFSGKAVWVHQVYQSLVFSLFGLADLCVFVMWTKQKSEPLMCLTLKCINSTCWASLVSRLSNLLNKCMRNGEELGRSCHVCDVGWNQRPYMDPGRPWWMWYVYCASKLPFMTNDSSKSFMPYSSYALHIKY